MFDMSWLYREEDVPAAVAKLNNSSNNDAADDDNSQYDFLAISYRGILHAADLAILLTKMHQLEKIVITDVALEGDLAPVAKALTALPHLIAVELKCDAKGDEAFSTMPCLGRALSGLSLESLRIHHNMTLLLTSLVLGTSAMKASQLTVMFDERVPDKTISHCLAILERSTTLRSLKLTGLYGPHELKSEQSILSLGQMVLCNKSLVRLEATVAPGVSLVPIAESLKGNTTLEHLNLNPSWSTTETPVDPDEVNLFYNVMAHHNFTLRSLSVLPPAWGSLVVQSDESVEKKWRSLDFLCAMNGFRSKHTGMAVRKQLVDDGTATIEDMFEFMERESGSIAVSGLFYHLHLNPALWLPTPTSTQHYYQQVSS